MVPLWALVACGGDPAPPPASTSTATTTSGLPKAEIEDRLVFEETPLDILFVIDNSPAMTPVWDDVKLLVDNVLGNLTSTPVDVAWQIAFITMDMDQPDQSGRLIEVEGYTYLPRWAPYPRVLAASLMEDMPLNGGKPRGRDAAWSALVDQADGLNSGFYRPDAALAIIAITNDDDHSEDVTQDAWLEWLQTSKWSGSDLLVYSVASPEPTCPTAIASSPDWIAASTATSGASWTVCSVYFPDLANDVNYEATGWAGEIAPSETPNPATLFSWYELGQATIQLDRDIDWEWDAEDGVVRFLAYGPPEPGTEVVIRYTPL
jgi:hypothetical protein